MRLSSSTGAMPSYGGGWPLELQESTATGVIDEREQALYGGAARASSPLALAIKLRAAQAPRRRPRQGMMRRGQLSTRAR